MKIQAGTIRKVSIANIFNLKSYNLSEKDGRVMHILEFKDGSTWEITYKMDGTLEVFEGNPTEPDGNVSINLGDDGHVTLGTEDDIAKM